MPRLIDQRTIHGVEVHLWLLDLREATDAELLSPDERKRADRLLIADKRRQFVAARAGLRRILGGYTGRPPEALTFAAQADGKPFLVDESGWEFNLTHSEDSALVAVAHRQVGIDLERERPLPDLQHMAEIAFSPQEQADLRALPAEVRPRAFFRTWTRKEALLKGHGGGFRLAHTFSLPVTDQPLTMTVGHWLITDVEIGPAFVAALAVDGAR